MAKARCVRRSPQPASFTASRDGLEHAGRKRATVRGDQGVYRWCASAPSLSVEKGRHRTSPNSRSRPIYLRSAGQPTSTLRSLLSSAPDFGPGGWRSISVPRSASSPLSARSRLCWRRICIGRLAGASGRWSGTGSPWPESRAAPALSSGCPARRSSPAAAPARSRLLASR